MVRCHVHLLLWVALLATSFQAFGQAPVTPSRRDALTAIEREQLQKLLEAQARGTHQNTPQSPDTWLAPLPNETPCFVVRQVDLLGETPQQTVEDFRWLTADLSGFLGACLGAGSVDVLRSNLDRRLAARGYVTSYISVPEQNLGQGRLQLMLHVGRLAGVKFDGPASNALAVQPGQALNLRDIEQTLENLSRLPSQASQFQIEPGEQPGFSVLVMTPLAAPDSTQARPWRLSAGLDNAAAREYGPWQSQVQFALDAPLGLSDQLTASMNRTLPERGGEQKQSSSLLTYFIPWGYHALLLTASRSSHSRPIQGLSTRFTENGFDSSRQLRLQSAVLRSASSRWTLWAGHTQRRARNYVDDVELILQRRRVNTWDWGFDAWTRWATGDMSLAYEQSVSTSVAAKTDFEVDAPPLARFKRLHLSWQQNLHLGGNSHSPASGPQSTPLRLQYEARLSWAGVQQPASGSDLQSLGSRWSVRGFDAQGFISGREQFTLKQDMRGPAWQGRGLWAQPYAALDYGRVAAATSGQGQGMAGAALGLRLQGAGFAGLSGWAGDIAAAKPLLQPRGLARTGTVFYASVSFLY